MLVLTVNRVRLVGNRTEANQEQFDVPDTITVPTLDSGPKKYRLVSAIEHQSRRGSGGHYVAHLKRNNNLVVVNDARAIEFSPPNAIKKCDNGLGMARRYWKIPSES